MGERMARLLSLVVAPALAVAQAGLILDSTRTIADAQVFREVPLSEALAVRGGVGVDSYIAFTTAPNDNIYFAIDWSTLPAYQGSPQTVAIFADNNTKVKTKTVSGASGTWETRTLWPISGYKTFNFKWLDAGSAWTTTHSGSQHRVDPEIHMINVRVWNTTIGGTTTNVTHSRLSSIFDNMSTNYMLWDTDSVDVIYRQCTPNKHLQFRLQALQTMTLTNCPATIPIGAPGGTEPNWGISDACVEEAFDDATGGDGADLSRLNIIMLDELRNPVNGFHIRGNDYASEREYWIGIEAGWASDDRFDELIAHEVGHFLMGHHSSACDGTLDPHNNIMCPSSDARGRAITSAQCTNAYNNLPPYYIDQN